MDGLQHGELLLHHPAEKLLVADKQIPVAGVLEQQAPGAGDPGVDLLVDLGPDGALGRLAAGLHQLLVVVHHQHAGHKAAGLVELLHMPTLGEVHEVGGDGLAGAPASPPAGGAVDQVGLPLQLRAPAHLPALQNPLVVKVGGQLAHAHVQHVLPRLRQAGEALVGPDDLAAVRLEHHHGQGGVEHAVFTDGVHAAGDGLNIPHHVVPSACALTAVEQVQQHQSRQLHRRQHRLEGRGDAGKGGEAEKIGLQVRLYQP